MGFKDIINQNKSNLYYCYGNVLFDANKIICSCREKTAGTQYNKEITIETEKSENILNNTIEPVFRANSISHNFSILKIGDLYIGIGGASMPSYKVAHDTGRPGPATYAGIGIFRDGLYLLKSDNCKNWTHPNKIIDRDWGLRNECCAFDSQPSLLFDNSSNLYYLYCRWNPEAGVRKMQVFTTDTIDNWKNNAQEIKVDKLMNIYTSYVFKYEGRFLAIVRSYTSDLLINNPNHTALMYELAKLRLLVSNDGINYIFIKDILEDYDWIKHGDVTQGHKIVDNKIVICLLCEDGKINEYYIEL